MCKKGLCIENGAIFSLFDISLAIARWAILFISTQKCCFSLMVKSGRYHNFFCVFFLALAKNFFCPQQWFFLSQLLCFFSFGAAKSNCFSNFVVCLFPSTFGCSSCCVINFQFFFQKYEFQKNWCERLWSPHYLLKWQFLMLNFSLILFFYAKRGCALKTGLFSPYLIFLWRLKDELFFLFQRKKPAFH